jgi:hypothetical protein
MDCAEQKDLQRKCTAAWEAYWALRSSGLSIASSSSIVHIRYPSRSLLEVPKLGLLMNPQTVQLVLSPETSAAIRLRGEHLKASRELSSISPTIAAEPLNKNSLPAQ